MIPKASENKKKKKKKKCPYTHRVKSNLATDVSYTWKSFRKTLKKFIFRLIVIFVLSKPGINP